MGYEERMEARDEYVAERAREMYGSDDFDGHAVEAIDDGVFDGIIIQRIITGYYDDAVRKRFEVLKDV